jgi:hypothetical protein
MGLEQFGSIGGEIASHAGRLLDYLVPVSGDSGDQLDWQRADYLALGDWLELEEAVPLIDVFDDVEGGDRRKLHETLHAFHTALPFDEAERGWLGKIYDRLSEGGEYPSREMPRLIEGHEDQIMVEGLRKAVNGRDLMRRWIAWRRESGEYEGQGSLDQAREALGGLRELLS